mmetsp:Transcript_21274/g.44811  ORF Transcript_21274/g.44811 Transcript_21274/m.44811 type:complete len:329 (-) Transcript_21274:205-1191(-)
MAVVTKAFLFLSTVLVGEAFLASTTTTSTSSASRISTGINMVDPTTVTMALGEGMSEEFTKSIAIALVLGGGLIPATISANSAMFSTLSGRKGYTPEGQEPAKGEETFENYDPNNTFDPTMGDAKNIKYREYVLDSGATGPELPSSALLLAADKIPVADVVAVLGRIDGLDSIANWKDLPSTRRGTITPGVDPPMWLPRKAFKVQVRKNKFLGWPMDPKTGLPVGGEELKQVEEKRIAKKDAIIGDAALDAVFDSWTGGASVATPDKVKKGLSKVKPTPGKNDVDLDAFVQEAVLGRANTAFAAFTFVVIQIVAFGGLFVRPLIEQLS